MDRQIISAGYNCDDMGCTIWIGKDAVTSEDGQSIEDAVRSSGLRPDSYLFLIDGTPVPMDVIPIDGTVVKALRVASGG